jgi:arylformamidase
MQHRHSRRAFLGTAAGVLTLPRHARAGQPATSQPRAKGPLVWLDMDQKELDDAYNQSVYAPNMALVTDRIRTRSAEMAALLGHPKRFAYGTTPIEALDVYATEQRGAPVNIYIHGGAWRAGLARENAHGAEVFVRAGAHFVVPDFVNVIEAGGDLMPLADQVRRAVAWVFRNADQFGGDARRIYVSGHSSGAHLAGVVLTTDWRKDFDLPPDVVKGAVCSSGMFDLKAVRLSARSAYVKFTDQVEQTLSPQRHPDKLHAPVVLIYGTEETPEFQRQSRDFAAALKAAGKPVELIVGKHYNHFEIMETLGNPYGLAGRAALKQMNLGECQKERVR